jgi:hypothetical protein
VLSAAAKAWLLPALNIEEDKHIYFILASKFDGYYQYLGEFGARLEAAGKLIPELRTVVPQLDTTIPHAHCMSTNPSFPAA